MPWSSSGLTSISFSIWSYNGSALPSWITIDSTSGELKILAPSVYSNTDYYFCINSAVSSVSSLITKLIKLTVSNCSVQNWQTCSDSNGLVCSVWMSRYILLSGSCSNKECLNKENNTQVSETAKSLTTTTQSVVGTLAGIVVTFSFLNTSSLSSLWSMVNQVQIFYLLLLTKAYIPNDVQDKIKGTKILMNPSSFIPFKNIGIYYSVLKYFKFDLRNVMFESVDIESDSTIYNWSSFLSLVFLFILIHFIVIVLKYLRTKISTERCSLLRRWSSWPINKIYNIMTFSHYIRFCL